MTAPLSAEQLAEIRERLARLRTDRYPDGSAVPCQSVDGHDGDAEDVNRLLAHVDHLTAALAAAERTIADLKAMEVSDEHHVWHHGEENRLRAALAKAEAERLLLARYVMNTPNTIYLKPGEVSPIGVAAHIVAEAESAPPSGEVGS